MTQQTPAENETGRRKASNGITLERRRPTGNCSGSKAHAAASQAATVPACHAPHAASPARRDRWASLTTPEHEALVLSEQRYRALFEQSAAAAYSCDASGLIHEFNHRATELWGRTPVRGDTDPRFCGAYKLFRSDGSSLPHAESAMALVATGELSAVESDEVDIERPDGSRVTVIANIRPLVDPQGNVIGAVSCFFDITRRNKVEIHERLLLNELVHRSRNLLAVIEAIVARSLSDAETVAVARERLLQRLQALAHTQALLQRASGAAAPLREIIRLALKPFPGLIAVDGPDVMLSSTATQSFALIVHELATNAIKYGALSAPWGRVAVEWSVDNDGTEPRIQFTWLERGGPRIAPPSRRGFGLAMIGKVAAEAFGSAPKIDFAAEGLSYVVHMPLALIGIAQGAKL